MQLIIERSFSKNRGEKYFLPFCGRALLLFFCSFRFVRFIFRAVWMIKCTYFICSVINYFVPLFIVVAEISVVFFSSSLRFWLQTDY